MTRFPGKLMLASVVVSGMLSLGLASGAHASPGSGDPFDLHFDEFGNATYQANGGPTVHEHGVDIGDGYLSYLLPEQIGLGDVSIAGSGEPCSSASDCSDGLRFLFDARSGNYYMQYYSDPGTALADTGFPSDFNFGFIGATESNTENAYQAFEYHPGGNNYFGVSDVPEPASWAMMLIGFAAIGYATRRRARDVIAPV